VGLLKLVATREKGGVLEKYYRTIAPNSIVPNALLRSLPPGDSTRAAGEVLRLLTDGLLRVFSAAQQTDSEDTPPGFLVERVAWLTPEEFTDLKLQFNALLDRYKDRRGRAGERERMVALLGYDIIVAGADASGTSGAVDEATGQRPPPVSRSAYG
jgi:hypothetical protein